MSQSNTDISKVGAKSKPDESKPGHFVMTERAAHEAWARLSMKKPRAAALMHVLVSRMDSGTNAVVASHKTLAGLLHVSTKSIKNWIDVLEQEKWIQRVSLGPGTVNAYVVNSAVAWARGRDKLQYASFKAQIIANADDQSVETLSAPDLRKIPTLYDSEWQLPSGAGEEPPSQAIMDGMEPDLPARFDRETGEVFEDQQDLDL